MIVFFLPNLRPGGAERVMLNVLLSYHAAYPHAKLVLLLGEKTGPLLSEIPTTIPIYSLGAANATKSIRPLIKFCKVHQPQVVFSSLGSALAASVAKRFVSSKIVFSSATECTATNCLALASMPNVLYFFKEKLDWISINKRLFNLSSKVRIIIYLS